MKLDKTITKNEASNILFKISSKAFCLTCFEFFNFKKYRLFLVKKIKTKECDGFVFEEEEQFKKIYHFLKNVKMRENEDVLNKKVLKWYQENEGNQYKEKKGNIILKKYNRNNFYNDELYDRINFIKINKALPNYTHELYFIKKNRDVFLKELNYIIKNCRMTHLDEFLLIEMKKIIKDIY